MRIFVSGPYSAPTLAARTTNVRRAIRAATELMHKGHQPFLPHLSHYWDGQARVDGKPIEYERWMEYDFHWLRLCDAVLYLGPSPGACREVDLALELGIPVYHSVGKVPDAEGV